MSIFVVFISFVLLFLIVVEVFSILLKLTGLHHKKARFQVISLLTSTGFSTKESEQIVQHPTRRKIASMIMIFGYASSVTLVSFVIKILEKDARSISILVVIFAIMVVVLYLLSKIEIIDKIEAYLEDNIRTNSLWLKFDENEQEIISRNKGYGIVEIYLKEGHKIIDKSIEECKLTSIEIQILCIDKNGELVKFPTKEYVFAVKDRITVYGNLKNINMLFNSKIKK